VVLASPDVTRISDATRTRRNCRTCAADAAMRVAILIAWRQSAPASLRAKRDA
jgi:hypothetical protein